MCNWCCKEVRNFEGNAFHRPGGGSFRSTGPEDLVILYPTGQNSLSLPKKK